MLKRKVYDIIAINKHTKVEMKFCSLHTACGHLLKKASAGTPGAGWTIPEIDLDMDTEEGREQAKWYYYNLPPEPVGNAM